MDIKKKINALPNKPGVYLMKDRLSRIIYVGKASRLKTRVATYFHSDKKFSFQKFFCPCTISGMKLQIPEILKISL